MQPLLVTGRRVIGATIPLRGSRGWDWYYKAKEMQKIKPKPSPIWENKEKKPRTRVYFDLATETKESKRVVIELLDDIVPTTAMNFKNLIIGTNGLHYKDCTFFDIRKDQFVCSGAVKGEKRLGGYSSFAKQYFDDENFIAQYPYSPYCVFLHLHPRHPRSRHHAQCGSAQEQLAFRHHAKAHASS
ncbi:hypothetical protein WA556_003155 [Blastocystis sp. ATCC 50177/Nand II]